MDLGHKRRKVLQILIVFYIQIFSNNSRNVFKRFSMKQDTTAARPPGQQE